MDSSCSLYCTIILFEHLNKAFQSLTLDSNSFVSRDGKKYYTFSRNTQQFLATNQNGFKVCNAFWLSSCKDLVEDFLGGKCEKETVWSQDAVFKEGVGQFVNLQSYNRTAAAEYDQ